MSRFHAVPYEDSTDINLSPMLDVVFIMLIFFIITASFVREQGLGVDQPLTAEAQPEFVDSIVVKVEAGGQFLINGHATSAGSVRSYVQALHGENPEASFAVQLGQGSIVRDAAVAIDAGRSIGIEAVPLIPAE